MNSFTQILYLIMLHSEKKNKKTKVRVVMMDH